MKKIFRSFALVTVTAVITRLLSFVFKIYLSRALGAEILLATFGEQGSMACDGAHIYRQSTIPCAHLENTCGAGDSFGAGFLNGLYSGQDIQTSMRMGAELAAQVVGTFQPYF